MTYEEIQVDLNYRNFRMYRIEQLFEKRDELESLHENIIDVVASSKFLSTKRNFKELFLKNNVSFENYPKISKYFFQNL